MAIIANLLDRLAALRDCLTEREALAQTFIPQALQDEISNLTEQSKSLEKEIKARAKYSVKHTLEGKTLQLVWQERLNTTALVSLCTALGATQEQIEDCRTSGYWSIRRRGK